MEGIGAQSRVWRKEGFFKAQKNDWFRLGNDKHCQNYQKFTIPIRRHSEVQQSAFLG